MNTDQINAIRHLTAHSIGLSRQEATKAVQLFGVQWALAQGGASNSAGNGPRNDADTQNVPNYVATRPLQSGGLPGALESVLGFFGGATAIRVPRLNCL